MRGLSLLVLFAGAMVWTCSCASESSDSPARAAGSMASPAPAAPTTAPVSPTVAEFRPALADRIAKLPPAAAQSLLELLDALQRENDAIANTHRAAGSHTMIAGVTSYDPSDDELLASELGHRIEQVLRQTPPQQVDAILSASGREEIRTSYMRIVLHRANVAGTGPVVFADPPANKVIQFKRISPK